MCPALMQLRVELYGVLMYAVKSSLYYFGTISRSLVYIQPWWLEAQTAEADSLAL